VLHRLTEQPLTGCFTAPHAGPAAPANGLQAIAFTFHTGGYSVAEVVLLRNKLQTHEFYACIFVENYSVHIKKTVIQNVSDGGGGDIVPADLQGMWLQDNAGTEPYLRFNGTHWGRDSEHSDIATDDSELHWKVTSSTGNKIEYQHNLYPNMDTKGWFNWEVQGTTLTISNSTLIHPDGTEEASGWYLSNGTYTKQP
jgi:hypothetical protein